MASNYEDDYNIRFLQLTKAQVPYVYSIGIYNQPLPANYNINDYAGKRYDGMNVWIGDGSTDDNARIYSTASEATFEIAKQCSFCASHRTILNIDAGAMGLNIGDEFIFNGAIYGMPPRVKLSTGNYGSDEWMTTNAEQTQIGKGRYKVIEATKAILVDSFGSGKHFMGYSGDFSKSETVYYLVEGEDYTLIQTNLNEHFQKIKNNYIGQYVNDNPVLLIHSNGMGYMKEEIRAYLASNMGSNITELSICYNCKQLWNAGQHLLPGYGGFSDEDTDEQIEELYEDLKTFADTQTVPCVVNLACQTISYYSKNRRTGKYRITMHTEFWYNDYVSNQRSFRNWNYDRYGSAHYFDITDDTEKEFNDNYADASLNEVDYDPNNYPYAAWHEIV